MTRRRSLPLIKERRSKCMDIEKQAPVKNLLIQFHLHLSNNTQWLADFSRYFTSHLYFYISSTSHIFYISSFLFVFFTYFYHEYWSDVICHRKFLKSISLINLSNNWPQLIIFILFVRAKSGEYFSITE